MSNPLGTKIIIFQSLNEANRLQLDDQVGHSAIDLVERLRLMLRLTL